MSKENESNFLIVHENEVELFLININEYNKIIDNKILCSECNSIININNFGSIIKLNSQYYYTCNNKECLHSLKRKLRLCK